MKQYEASFTITVPVTLNFTAESEEMAEEFVGKLSADNILLDRYLFLKTLGGDVHKVQTEDLDIELDNLEELDIDEQKKSY